MTIFALDIETQGARPDLPYALEPYRVKSGQSQITSVAIHNSDGYHKQVHMYDDHFILRLRDLIESLHGEIVFAHNAVFDVSFLIATLGAEIVRPIRWRDTATLNKYLINGQKADEMNISYSLSECVRRAIKEDPDLEEFLDVKSQKVTPGEDKEYWLKRGRMDARFTLMLAEKLMGYLTPEMTPGFLVASSAIFPLAQGWVQGIPIDKEEVKRYETHALQTQESIRKKLNISGTVITSTKQLSQLLFEQWGYQPIGVTPKGTPSVSSENLLRLHQVHSDDERIRNIMAYKKIATMLSKYIKGFYALNGYIGEWTMHGSPRILSTITGRMTYSSKLLKKYQTSIAMHQIPRKDKGIKRCLVAPPGYKVMYFDFNAQEARLMANVGPEPRMCYLLNNGMDLHSDLTEEIFGTPYSDIVRANEQGEPKEIVEQRQAGKLTGLSSFYRIGAPSLAKKFFSTYEYDISVQTAQSYLSSFKRKYPGVPEYWKRAIMLARNTGYAEAIGGFRYRIKSFGWQGESSAINHPIQGSGSMLCYTAIGLVSKWRPDFILASQMHDSLVYFVPEDNYMESATEVIHKLNKFNYGNILNFEQTVSYRVDGAVGDNFTELQPIV